MGTGYAPHVPGDLVLCSPIMSSTANYSMQVVDVCLQNEQKGHRWQDSWKGESCAHSESLRENPLPQPPHTFYETPPTHPSKAIYSWCCALGHYHDNGTTREAGQPASFSDGSVGTSWYAERLCEPATSAPS